MDPSFENEFFTFTQTHRRWESSSSWFPSWPVLFWNKKKSSLLILRRQTNGQCCHRQRSSCLSPVHCDRKKPTHNRYCRVSKQQVVVHGCIEKHHLRRRHSKDGRSEENRATHPGLVTGFSVDAHFLSSSKQSFTGQVNHGQKQGYHSMVLIGARKEWGRFWFLLQNWWDRRYFIEVDWEYLQSSDCRIVFVMSSAIPPPTSSFTCVTSSYAETNTDTGEDLDEIINQFNQNVDSTRQD